MCYKQTFEDKCGAEIGFNAGNRPGVRESKQAGTGRGSLCAATSTGDASGERSDVDATGLRWIVAFESSNRTQRLLPELN